MKTNCKKILPAIFLSVSFLFLKSQVITHHNPVFQPDFQKPLTENSFIDPKFNSSVTRLTDSKNQGFAGLFPDYSKRQAWNSDESLLMLRAGGGEVLIYDASTFQFIKTMPSNFTGIQDIFWHPSDPVKIYFFADNTFNSVNVNTEQITLLRTFGNYNYITTRAEGNLSNDAGLVALVGYNSNWDAQDFFVYDILSDTVSATLNIAGTNAQNLDWLSISPMGNYVIVDYADEVTGQFHGVEVYDKQFNLIWQKPMGAGHSDYGIDPDGKEILVMDYYDANTNFIYLKKIILEDGSITNLLALSAYFDMHESCRNINMPGWVYISTFDYVGRLTDDSLGWLPFEDEIFALKTDGSGDVMRLAHHHSRRFSPITPDSDNSVYFAEPHATVNRDGTKIIFGSNWREEMQTDSSIEAYFLDVENLFVSSGFFLKDNIGAGIYPNPISKNGTIEFKIPSGISSTPVSIEIYDLSGRKIKTVFKNNLAGGKYIFTFEISGISNGIYLLRLTAGNINQHIKIEIIQ